MNAYMLHYLFRCKETTQREHIHKTRVSFEHENEKLKQLSLLNQAL